MRYIPPRGGLRRGRLIAASKLYIIKCGLDHVLICSMGDVFLTACVKIDCRISSSKKQTGIFVENARFQSIVNRIHV